MKYRPPLGLSRPLDRDCAVVIAADRDARSPRDVLLAVVPFDEALPGQRHPRASRRHRHLRGAAGDSVRFHAVGRPVAPGAAIPSRAPPPGSSFLPCLVLNVRLHTALE